MNRFEDALVKGGWCWREPGYWSFAGAAWGFESEVEICLEPLLYGQFYLAIYRNGKLVGEKVPIRPGGPGSQEESR